MSITDFNQKKFMKEVRACIKANNLSIRKFAKLSKVAVITLYRLERGESEISFSTIRKLETFMKSYAPS